MSFLETFVYDAIFAPLVIAAAPPRPTYRVQLTASNSPRPTYRVQPTASNLPRRHAHHTSPPRTSPY